MVQSSIEVGEALVGEKKLVRDMILPGIHEGALIIML